MNSRSVYDKENVPKGCNRVGTIKRTIHPLQEKTNLPATLSTGQLEFETISMDDYEMSPPKQKSDHQILPEESQVVDNALRAGFDLKGLMESDNPDDHVSAKLLCFVFAKEEQLRRGYGLMGTGNQESFEDAVRKVTTDFNFTSSSVETRKRRDLWKLLCDHDCDRPIEISSGMLQQFPNWIENEILSKYVQSDNLSGEATDRSGATTIFGSHQIDPILRIQPYKKCYATAAAVSAAYYRWIKDPNKEFQGVVDISKCIRNNLDDTDMAKFMFGGGGDSLDALIDFLGGDFRLRFLRGNKQTPKRVGSILREHGPLMLRNFRGKLDKKNRRVLYEGPMGDDDYDKAGGRHTVLIVGVRYDSVVNKWYYLIQNWWKKLQFFEMDEDYFLSCGATIAYCAEDEEAWAAIPSTKELYYAMNEYRIANSYIDGAALEEDDYYDEDGKDREDFS